MSKKLFHRILLALFILVISIFIFKFDNFDNKVSAANGFSWVEHNNGISGVNIAGIAVDPTNTNVVYVLTGSNGVYKSLDGGNSWSAANNGFPSNKNVSWNHLFGNLLTIDLKNPQILYTNIGGRVYKTIDGGQNWLESNSGITSCAIPQIAGVLVDPQNSNHLFAGHVASGCGGGLYESSNQGSNWTQIAGWNVGSGLANDAWTLAIDPTDNQKLYVATVHTPFYRSTDGGHTWIAGWPTGNTNADESATVVAISTTNPNTVFVGGSIGFFKSDDFGRTFTSLASQVPSYVFDIKFSQSDPNIAYAAAREGLYKTINGGLNWSFLGHKDISPKALAIDPTNPDIVYIGTVGVGIYKSTDGGTNITNITGTVPNSINIRFLKTSANAYFVGVTGQGIYKSDDQGQSWNLVYPGVSYALTLDISKTNPNIMVATTAPDGVIKSTDGGDTWNVINTLTLSKVYIFPDDANKMIGLNGKTVLSSSDGGSNWQTTNPAAFSSSSYINMLMIDPNNSSLVYALGLGDFYKSTDGGTTWTSSNSGISHNWVDYGIVNPYNSNILYISTRDSQILQSKNNGTSWQSFGYLPSGKEAFSLAVDPNDTNTIYAADYYGWYKKTEDGSWIGLDLDGLPTNIFPVHLAIDPNNSSNFITATNTGGVYIYKALASPTPAKQGDINNDGHVNISDLGLLLSNFGKTGAGITGDVNNDGHVNISDLGILLSNFGT